MLMTCDDGNIGPPRDPTTVAAGLALLTAGEHRPRQRITDCHPRIAGRKRPKGTRNPGKRKPANFGVVQRAKGWAWKGDGVEPEPTRQMIRAELRRRARTAERDAAKVAVADAIRSRKPT